MTGYGLAEVAAVRHGLRFGDSFGARFEPIGAMVGFTGRLEDGRLVLRATTGNVVAVD